jgi:hypothetical protein
MANLKRYEFSQCGDCASDMLEDNGSRWVKFDDIKELLNTSTNTTFGFVTIGMLIVSVLAGPICTIILVICIIYYYLHNFVEFLFKHINYKGLK